MQNNLTIISNNYLPLRDVVFQTLEQAILMGDLKPGERLMEIHLAEQLGVSRTPIREAIRKLEQEGLVVNIPRRGAYVAEITKKDLSDVLEVRSALEELAVELACRRISPEELAELKTACARFIDAIGQNDLEQSARQDIAFHDVIYKASRNDRLIQMATNLRMQMYRYRIEYLKDESAHPVLIHEHRALIDCIERKDIPGAKNVMRSHIENQANAVSKKAQ